MLHAVQFGTARAGTAPHPPGAGGRPSRGHAVDDQRKQVLPDGDDRRRHGEIAAPRANRDRPVGVDHQRGGPVHQRADDPAFRVVATMGVCHLETAVERRDQDACRCRRNGRGVFKRAAAGRQRPRVQARGQQVRIHPGDPGAFRATGRNEQRLVDRRLAIDEPSSRVPHSLANVGRRSGKWLQRTWPGQGHLPDAGRARTRPAARGDARRRDGHLLRLRLFWRDKAAGCQCGHAY